MIPDQVPTGKFDDNTGLYSKKQGMDLAISVLPDLHSTAKSGWLFLRTTKSISRFEVGFIRYNMLVHISVACRKISGQPENLSKNR
ncbi:MAG: hypothetical protein A2521_09210 [Deltaproteobacteria bacterium RIFOXYD12_FULL_57_12]|nr:MAG: hypothetical protein A2521_09210 [Deltaproteobacteria bacterium RIFOXYD12_FULL_57_12]